MELLFPNGILILDERVWVNVGTFVGGLGLGDGLISEEGELDGCLLSGLIFAALALFFAFVLLLPWLSSDVFRWRAGK